MLATAIGGIFLRIGPCMLKFLLLQLLVLSCDVDGLGQRIVDWRGWNPTRTPLHSRNYCQNTSIQHQVTFPVWNVTNAFLHSATKGLLCLKASAGNSWPSSKKNCHGGTVKGARYVLSWELGAGSWKLEAGLFRGGGDERPALFPIINRPKAPEKDPRLDAVWWWWLRVVGISPSQGYQGIDVLMG